MKSRRQLSVLVLAGFAVPGLVSANPVTCEQGGLLRRVEVVYASPGQSVPCEVIYDKSGEGSIETVWRANNEAGYCEARAMELIEKLSAMGWSCASATAQARTPDSGTD